MKQIVKGVICLVAAGFGYGAFGARYYVSATATGSGDGSSWANTKAWAEAFTACATSTEDNEIWLTGDVEISAIPTTVTIKGNLTISGGYDGDDLARPDKRYPLDRVSTFYSKTNSSGGGTYDLFDVSVSAGCTLSFEHVSFAHAAKRAIKKSGAGNIALTDCRLSCNGWSFGHREGAPGCGLYSAGAGTVSLVNTIVDGNGPIHYTQQSTDGGWGVFVTGAAGVTIDNCNFVTNGIWRGDSNGSYQEATKGFALHVVNSKLALSNSRFAGNVSKPGRANNKAGGTIFLEGACGDSRIENCTFIGNLDLAGNEGSGTSGGICIVNMKNATDKLTVCGTTFAYNNTQSTGYGAGGLTVYKGAVTVTDSTFYRNFVGNANARWGTDISILADATLSISNSTLEGLDSRFASCVTPGSLTMDVATMKTDDPMLTTSVLDAESLIIWGQTSLYIENVNPINVKYEATYFKLAAFDATPILPRPKPDVGEGNVLYVKGDATGADDGSCWANAFTTLEKAFAVVSEKKNEIWVAGDLVIAADPAWTRIDDTVVVRGGFVGTDGTEGNLASRPAGAKATVDGENACDLVQISVKADRVVSFENFIFVRAKNHAVNKRGHGDIAFVNCDFLNNGRTQKASGRAIYSTGEAGCAALSVSNCFFGGQMYDTADENTGHGAAIYLSNYRRLTIDDSLFVSNGMGMAKQGTNAGGAMGSAIYGYNTPATMRTSRFSGNCNAVKAATGNGGTVALYGFLDGSAFTNCVWSGNYELHRDSNSQSTGGALLLSPSGASHKIDIQSCTFAYNVSQGAASASALNIRSGDVTVNNSIFWKNPHGMTSVFAYGCEIEAAGGTTVVKNSVVTSKDMVYCHSGTATALTLDPDTVYTDDPCFVTSNEVFDAMYSGASYLDPTAAWTYEKAASLDVHLLSPEKYFLNDGTEGPKVDTLSPAVDKGDESSDCSHETTPNGGRINIGAYGNTPEGSATPYGVPQGEDFTIDYPNGITRPRVSLKLGLAEGSGYTATVVLNCYQNEVLIETETFAGKPSGTTVEWLVPHCFPEGAADLTFTYEIQVAGVSPATGTKASSVEGEPPPYAEKGGDPVKIIHVRAGADYHMDGTSWADAFPDIKSAFDAVTDDTEEIWVSEGILPVELALTLTRPLKVRGGFASTENSPEQRLAGTHTVFDYNNISPGWTVNNSAALTIERIDFVRAKSQALNKSGAGDLTLDSCTLLNNGRNCPQNQHGYSGRALYAKGSSGATIVVTNCSVRGNIADTNCEKSYPGCAFYIESCKRLVMDDTLFASNGLHIVNNTWSFFGGCVGFAVYATATPVTARRCQFRANAGGSRSGGAVVYAAGCDKCAFTNCVFTGNYERQDGSQNTSNCGGALTLDLGNNARTADIKSCTFAYNLTTTSGACGGLTVNSGSVTVKDTIFYRNLRGRNRTDLSDDIYVCGGSCIVTHSLITGKGTEHARASASATLSLDPDTVYAFNPSFVSSYEDDFLALYTVSDTSVSLNKSVTYSDLAALDVHLLSPQGYRLNDGSEGPATTVYSQAIDKGDPEADWSQEPSPNGKHVNLGAYGNTKEASLTSVGQPEVTSFEVVNPNDYARPEAHLKMGIASGTDYAAKVTITCTQDGVEIGRCEQTNVHNGDEIVWLLPRFVDAGAELVYSYAIEADDAEELTGSSAATAGDKYPDYYGKGGGANVIHVRLGADCTPTGENWAHAYPDFVSGLAAAAERGKGEVWVSTGTFSFAGTAAFTNTVAIRGGFAGTENSAAERVEGARTILDNAGAMVGLQLSNAGGTTCTVERFVFLRALDRAIKKTGEGDLAVLGCRMSCCGQHQILSGRALHVSGSAGKSSVVVSNCVVDGNMTVDYNRGESTQPGAALYIDSCRRLTVDDSLFTSNGMQLANTSGMYSFFGYVRGSAIYANATPVTMRCSQFKANMAGNRSNGGGVVALNGNCSGSAFTNCVFTGNYEITDGSGDVSNYGGALSIALGGLAQTVDIECCTFAYNVTAAKAAAGLTVVKGAVTVKDSIFWKNLRSRDRASYAGDIEVKEGSCNVTYSSITSNDSSSCRGNVGTTLYLDPKTVRAFDPLFVSPVEDFYACYTVTDSSVSKTSAGTFDALSSFNVHLRGGRGYTDERTGELVKDYASETVNSPALDAGSHRAPREPRPNGGRKNLGAYGNTPWATRSVVAGSIIWFR